MKLVLCGNHSDFQKFKEVLWSKDKDISNYRYIMTPEDLNGYTPFDAKIVKLKSFENHMNRAAILEGVNYRFPNWRRPRSQVRGISPSSTFFDEVIPPSAIRFQDGGIVAGRRTGMDYQTLNNAVERVMTSEGWINGEHYMTDEQRESLIRIHQDAMAYEESQVLINGENNED